MAATEITVQSVEALAGAEPTFEAANVDGHFWTNDQLTVAIVRNLSAGTRTYTVLSQRQTEFGAYPSFAGTVNSGSQAWLPIFKPDRFNDAFERCHLTFDSVTNVEIAVLRLFVKFKD